MSSRKHPRHRRGHTLLEMTLSLVLLALVMSSVGSAVMFAASANPADDAPETTIANDGRALTWIAEDLAVARYVIEQSDHAVTIVVSDRTGDGNPDRIRYAWSGSYGDPLTFAINDDEPVNLLESVAVFSLDYTSETVTRQLPVAAYLADETVVDSFESSVSGGDEQVRPAEWFGQKISPTLSADAIGFLPTKLDIYAGWKTPKDGQANVNLRDLAGATPGSTSYAGATILESALSGATFWTTKAFSTASPVPDGHALALVFTYAAGTDEVLMLRSTSDGAGLLDTTDSGATWQQDTGKGLVYRLYGREILQDKNEHEITRRHVKLVSVSLQSAVSNRSPLTRKVGMILRPAKLDSFAETGFDADPTPMDLNGDGRAEWTHSSGTFPQASLVDGIWVCDGELIFEPTGLSSAEVITVKARMRSSDTLGPTIYGPYTINTDGKLLPIATQLRDDGQGGQELVIYNDTTMTTPRTTITGLPAGLIDIRLTLLPKENLLCIDVKNETVGSILLERIDNPGTIAQAVRIGSGGGVAEFGSIYIHVGGSYTSRAADDGGVIPDILDLLF